MSLLALRRPGAWISTLALALGLALTGAGCSVSGSPGAGDPSSGSAAATSAAPTTTPTPSVDAATAWTTRCTSQVSYWVTRLLAEPEHSYDYQEMGLSSQSYAALDEVMDAAGGRPRTSSWVQQQAADRCADHAERAVAPKSGEPGWP